MRGRREVDSEEGFSFLTTVWSTATMLLLSGERDGILLGRLGRCEGRRVLRYVQYGDALSEGGYSAGHAIRGRLRDRTTGWPGSGSRHAAVPSEFVSAAPARFVENGGGTFIVDKHAR